MADITSVLSDQLQPPMANGEVLFDEPWQGRVFGMAVALHEGGVFAWSEFQASLIDVVGEWDRAAAANEIYQYYNHFQTALHRLLDAKGLVSVADLEVRSETFAARPHDHDHEHEHEHEHEHHHARDMDATDGS